MTGGPNLIVCRLSIFSAMVAATVTLIYLAPVPDQSYKNCDRPCHDLDWPMICRFKLIVEKLPTPVICRDCHNCSFCSSSSNAPRELLTMNRQFPGPSLRVCHNDVLIVDVVNKLQGQSVTVHWRGQTNVETPFMDGVPLVTQCPIESYTTFQYKFRASSSGTHSYHAFSDSDRSGGVFGALIVRKAEKLDEHRQVFDVDSRDHVLVLSESGDSVLINGARPDEPLNFRVKEGSSYRFRVIYGSGTGCPLTLSVENHPLNVIYVEGNPVEPAKVSSIELVKGETVDFALTANKSPGSYKLEVRSNCNGKSLIGKAVLTYEGISQEGNAGEEQEEMSKSNGEDCGAGNGKTCLQDFQNTEEMDKELLTVQRRIYLGFDSIGVKGNADVRLRQFRTNNISFVFPPSPILTQPADVPVDLMCNESHLPDRCKDEGSCDCVHLEHIPLDSSTEIVLVDQGGDEEDGYIFHLHGYKFYQVGTKILDEPISKSQVEALDSNFDFINRNLKTPLIKSTVKLPKNGVVAIRFMAKNPGFWLLRDENSRGWTRGMDILFQVGDTGDIVTIPSNFPVCGNFIGPDFFLL